MLARHSDAEQMCRDGLQPRQALHQPQRQWKPLGAADTDLAGQRSPDHAKSIAESG
jgi:hypothetical protein